MVRIDSKFVGQSFSIATMEIPSSREGPRLRKCGLECRLLSPTVLRKWSHSVISIINSNPHFIWATKNGSTRVLSMVWTPTASKDYISICA
jgi:hypothetical protein